MKQYTELTEKEQYSLNRLIEVLEANKENITLEYHLNKCIKDILEMKESESVKDILETLKFYLLHGYNKIPIATKFERIKKIVEKGTPIVQPVVKYHNTELIQIKDIDLQNFKILRQSIIKIRNVDYNLEYDFKQRKKVVQDALNDIMLIINCNSILTVKKYIEQNEQAIYNRTKKAQSRSKAKYFKNEYFSEKFVNTINEFYKEWEQ